MSSIHLKTGTAPEHAYEQSNGNGNNNNNMIHRSGEEKRKQNSLTHSLIAIGASTIRISYQLKGSEHVFAFVFFFSL